jgi:predicted transporter
MYRHLSTGRLVELVLAILLLGAGIFFYRRRAKGDSYGSQGAVILFVVAVIMAIHALGGLDYHPSSAEAEYLRDHAR